MVVRKYIIQKIRLFHSYWGDLGNRDTCLTGIRAISLTFGRSGAGEDGSTMSAWTKSTGGRGVEEYVNREEI